MATPIYYSRKKESYIYALATYDELLRKKAGDNISMASGGGGGQGGRNRKADRAGQAEEGRRQKEKGEKAQPVLLYAPSVSQKEEEEKGILYVFSL